MYVEALFSCAVGSVETHAECMGPENGVLALGNTVETNKHRKRETWRLLVRSRRKGPERAYQMVAVKSACSTGVSRQTSQTQFKPLPSKQSMAKDDRTGMEISLPLLVLHPRWSHLMLSCSVSKKRVHQRKYHFSR